MQWCHQRHTDDPKCTDAGNPRCRCLRPSDYRKSNPASREFCGSMGGGEIILLDRKRLDSTKICSIFRASQKILLSSCMDPPTKLTTPISLRKLGVIKRMKLEEEPRCELVLL
ncbi:hypothetical protein AA313_de0207227 [Arthrobotrys entomopaga]|nr:hypothetical protein AA313_de0207227 [Arthrobotrys entomopaga]